MSNPDCKYCKFRRKCSKSSVRRCLYNICECFVCKSKYDKVIEIAYKDYLIIQRMFINKITLYIIDTVSDEIIYYEELKKKFIKKELRKYTIAIIKRSLTEV